MKKIAKSFVLITLVMACYSTAFASCSNGNDGGPKKAIKQTALNYLDAMANYRVDDAVPYCTKETQDGVIEFSRNLVKSVQTGYIESDTPAKVRVTKVEMTSDTTAIVHYHKKTPIKNQRGSVLLVQRDGKWLVHILLNRRENNNESK